MAGWTNKGKFRVMEFATEGGSVPATYYMALYTSDNTPDADTNVDGDLTDCPAGNGYTLGGVAVAPSTGFDSLTEDDSGDAATVQVVDVTWTASGGEIPTSGNALYYCALTDANATTASREIYWYWSLGADRTVSDGQELTVQDAEIDLNES